MPVVNSEVFVTVAVQEGDSRGYRSAEEQARELARSIRREVAKLADKWNALVDRSDAWGRCLDDAVQVHTDILCFITISHIAELLYFILL